MKKTFWKLHWPKQKKRLNRQRRPKSNSLQEQYLNEAKIKSNREAARIVESAKLKAKKILFDAINANMDSTFETIKNEMKTFAQKPDYKELLVRMVSYRKKHLGVRYYNSLS